MAICLWILVVRLGSCVKSSPPVLIGVAFSRCISGGAAAIQMVDKPVGDNVTLGGLRWKLVPPVKPVL